MRNCLTMAVNLERIATFDKSEVLVCLKETVAEIQGQEGSAEEAYIHFSCLTDGEIPPIWRHLQQFLAGRPAIRAAVCVCCTGKNAWDDYLLLHGAAEGEKPDIL